LTSTLLLLSAVAAAFGCGQFKQPKKGNDDSPNTYALSIRLGDTWDRKPFDIFDGPELLRHAGNATAIAGPGTAFYLGKLGDTHLVATNHHVCASSTRCVGWSLNFTVLGRSFKVSRFLGTWDSIELSLLAIDVAVEDEQLLVPISVGFDFSSPVVAGSRLFTSGFGSADDPSRLFFDASPDCQVISGNGSYKLMSDPDDVFTLPYQAWSFAIGCDISHGDSGSLIVDYATGKVKGVAWTGRIPKPDKVKSSAYLNALVGSDSPEVWSSLNYASPAEKIRERLQEALDNHELSGTDGPVVQALIERDSH
jgi:hypothetical protein